MTHIGPFALDQATPEGWRGLIFGTTSRSIGQACSGHEYRIASEGIASALAFFVGCLQGILASMAGMAPIRYQRVMAARSPREPSDERHRFDMSRPAMVSKSWHHMLGLVFVTPQFRTMATTSI